MKFQLLTLATTFALSSAFNLEQVRLLNDDELIIQDAQFQYPAIVNLKDEQQQEVEADKKKNKDKKTSLTTDLPSSTTISLSTSTTHSSTKSKKHSSSSSSSSSTKSKSHTASITKTGGADSVAAASVGGPLLIALGLLL